MPYKLNSNLFNSGRAMRVWQVSITFPQFGHLRQALQGKPCESERPRSEPAIPKPERPAQFVLEKRSSHQILARFPKKTQPASCWEKYRRVRFIAEMVFDAGPAKQADPRRAIDDWR